MSIRWLIRWGCCYVVLMMAAMASADTITVRQGYHTTGRNSDKALLLRIDLPAGMQASKLCFHLKGDTPKNITRLQVWKSDADEFFADASSELVAETSPGKDVELLLAEHQAHRLWLTAQVSGKVKLGATIDAALTAVCDANGIVLPVMEAVGDPEGEVCVFDTQSLAFVPTTDNCRFYRIPAMVVDREGNLLAAADRRYESNGDLGNHRIDVAIRKSHDGGRSWSPQQVIARGDGQRDASFGYGDPALAVTQSGRIICLMAAGRKGYFQGMTNMGVTVSDDNGVTWTAVRDLTANAFRDAAHGLTDSLGFWSIFATSGKGLTTADGTVLFTANTLQQAGTCSSDCYILSSVDEGQSWQLGPTKAFNDGDESKLVQQNDGSLLLSVRRRGARGFNTGSADAATWGDQWNNDDLTSGNACNEDILRYDKRILLHTYLKHPSSRANLTLAMSTDDGRTWRDMMNIQPGGAAYSTMVKMPNGDVGVLFEDESYTAGNGYALTFVTVTKRQIRSAYKKKR